MDTTIQERLKDLRVERGLTLEQLAEETHLSKSALGSYEGDNLKDISHHALLVAECLSIDELSQVYTFLTVCAVYPKGRKSARKTSYFHALGIVI